MSTIGAVGSNSMNTQGMHGSRRRPDPAEMAEKLFSKLDTSGQGYIEQSDLQKAFSQIGRTGESESASDLFAKLDSDSDGKVTKDEFSSALKAAAEQLDNQFASMRMRGGGSMPPPPPPPGNDAGFTKDELSSQINKIGASDSEQSSLISDIVQNFDEADSDGDGKVSFREAMAYDQSQSSSTSSSETKSTAIGATEDSNQKLMMQIMRLMQAYNPENSEKSAATTIVTTV